MPQANDPSQPVGPTGGPSELHRGEPLPLKLSQESVLQHRQSTSAQFFTAFVPSDVPASFSNSSDNDSPLVDTNNSSNLSQSASSAPQVCVEPVSPPCETATGMALGAVEGGLFQVVTWVKDIYQRIIEMATVWNDDKAQLERDTTEVEIQIDKWNADAEQVEKDTANVKLMMNPHMAEMKKQLDELNAENARIEKHISEMNALNAQMKRESKTWSDAWSADIEAVASDLADLQALTKQCEIRFNRLASSAPELELEEE